VLVAHRFRTGHRDIDLVMRRGRLVAFVEVKTRRGERFGVPVSAVGWRKQRELATGAAIWVARHGSPAMRYRFDVIGVAVIGQNVRIEHVKDAFSVEKFLR
jgi:putative endonuclease